MTLVTLLSGFVPVALLFAGAAWLAGGRRLGRNELPAVLGEALVVSLIAGLWFASLGAGGWAPLFVLFGLLVVAGERGRPLPPDGRPGRLVLVLLTLARYLAAGALLAWRLG